MKILHCVFKKLSGNCLALQNFDQSEHSTTNPLSQGGVPIFPISPGTEARGDNFLSPLKNEGGNNLGGIALLLPLWASGDCFWSS